MWLSMATTRREFCRFGGALAAGLPAAGGAATGHAQSGIVPGMVVALQGTPHLFIADEAGVLHWGGDTRALADRPVNWGQRVEVKLNELQAMPRGDPWLSAGLLKDGTPIYLVKWETEWPQPKLFHIQSIEDVELFGINGENYGRFVLDRPDWEQRYGISAAGLERQELAPAVPPPLYRANWALGLSGWNGGSDWKTIDGMLINDGTGSGRSAIIAPYRVPVADYAVETSIQAIRGYLFGIVLRMSNKGGYSGTINFSSQEAVIDHISSSWSFSWITRARRVNVAPGTWHTYRIEAKGNVIRFFVNGGLLLEAIDNRYLSGSEVALWSWEAQISVRSFRVLRV